MSLKIRLLNKELGQEVEAFDSIKDYEVRTQLLAQVIRCELMNLRSGNAHTKTRGEVSGGGKKPWKQKGTGRARHGSTRSPIWVGGGVAHGPRNTRNWHRKINNSMRIAALKSIIKDRLSSSRVFQFTEGFDFPKTQEAIPVLNLVKQSEEKSNKSTIILYTTQDKPMIRGFLNSEAKMVNVASNLKVYLLANANNLIFTPNAKILLETRLSENK